MLELLKEYKGKIEVNDATYNSIDEAVKAFKNYNGELVIRLNKGAFKSNKIESEKDDKIYKIKVRQYMTKPPTPEFDLHDKWNEGIPMPMRIMVGKKLQETKGMIKMQLHGQREGVETYHCMRCGRVLTNDISKILGIGPECGNHGYVNPFDNDEDLKKALKDIDSQLREIKWTGWIPKSALEEFIEIK